jgi:hypothetical protein
MKSQDICNNSAGSTHRQLPRFLTDWKLIDGWISGFWLIRCDLISPQMIRYIIIISHYNLLVKTVCSGNSAETSAAHPFAPAFPQSGNVSHRRVVQIVCHAVGHMAQRAYHGPREIQGPRKIQANHPPAAIK